MLAGFAIDLIGLDPNTRPGEVSESVLFDFGLTYVVIASLLVLSTWIFFPYSLDRKRHAEIVDTLARRRRGETATVADERTAA
jgi:Na+/melibiose symporter-like transporter